ncbi:ATP-binding cassette domain-containing protein [Nonomuraea sp. NPDC003201]
MNAFEAEGLVKRFGATTALDGIALSAPPGTVLGVLGPNGAGKTTAVRILATLLRPDAGRATVSGLDVVRHASRVRRLIGLTGQYASVDEDLTGTENLVLIGRLLDLRIADAKATAARLLADFGLAEAAYRRASTYSGGMRRRLDLAAGLVGRPDVIFLMVAVAVLLGFGFALGFRARTGPLEVLAACLLTVFFAFCVSWAFVLLGVLMREPGGVQGMAFMVLFPLTFGTSMITPKSTLPGWLQAWLDINPVNHAMNASRALMLGGPAGASVWWTPASGALFLAVFAPLAVAAYRRRA